MHALDAAQRGHLLGVLAYGERDESLLPAELPHAWAGLDTQDGSARFEVWKSPTPVLLQTHDGIACASNDEVLFGTIEFAESATFEAQTLAHYLRLFARIDHAGYRICSGYGTTCRKFTSTKTDWSATSASPWRDMKLSCAAAVISRATRHRRARWDAVPALRSLRF